MENPWESVPVWLAVIGLCGTFVNGLFNTLAIYLNHKETKKDIENNTRITNEVKESVNGKMDAMLVTVGNAREAVGKLAGIESEKLRAENERN